jgi:hypothetical protein
MTRRQRVLRRTLAVEGGSRTALATGGDDDALVVERTEHPSLRQEEVALADERIYRPQRKPMTYREQQVLGSVMALAPLLLLTQVIALWPSALAATTPRGQPETVWLFGLDRMVISPDGALLLLVSLVGALAALGEASFRFVTNAGRDELTSRWTWSYLLRPVQGATLAVIVYFALRGGLLGGDGTGQLNPYGLAAFAGLVGLFTRQAFQKLKEVFNTLWGVEDLDADIQPRPEPEGDVGSDPVLVDEAR